VHSTGHKSRLNRFEEENTSHKFGSKPYAQEELVAEIGAGFLCAEAGIFQAVEEDTAAYVANWLTKLENDQKLIVYAASKAAKAVDYILGSAEPQTEEAK
jgi:antirestriction protein ArdC